MSLEIDLKTYGDLCDKRRDLRWELAETEKQLKALEAKVPATNVGGGNYIGSREFENLRTKNG